MKVYNIRRADGKEPTEQEKERITVQLLEERKIMMHYTPCNFEIEGVEYVIDVEDTIHKSTKIHWQNENEQADISSIDITMPGRTITLDKSQEFPVGDENLIELMSVIKSQIPSEFAFSLAQAILSKFNLTKK